MSKYIEYVLDSEASLDDAPILAGRVVAVLVQRGIVLPTPQVHEYLAEGPKYATGPNASQVADHNDCFPCGLDIKTGRDVYIAGEYGLDALHCPSCGCRHAQDNLDWLSAIGEWQ